MSNLTLVRRKKTIKLLKMKLNCGNVGGLETENDIITAVAFFAEGLKEMLSVFQKHYLNTSLASFR